MIDNIPENDAKKGFDLLNRFLRVFPFSMDSDEAQLNAIRKDFIGSIWENFWLSVKAVLDEIGFTKIFSAEESFVPVHTVQNYNHNIHILTKTIIELLSKDIINCIYFIDRIYSFYISVFARPEDIEEQIKSNSRRSTFLMKFGFSNKNGTAILPDAIYDTVITPQGFKDKLSEIFPYLGHEIKFTIVGRGGLSIWIH